MKSQDVVVLLKLFLLQYGEQKKWTYESLAREVYLSVGETHTAVKRLWQSRLFDHFTQSAIPTAAGEFLIHGVQYAFPAEVGPLERGIPTAHSAPVLQQELSSADQDRYVWPYAQGHARGLSIQPLSKNAPAAALRDQKLYDFLALVDAIRIGKAREKNIAAGRLEALLREATEHGRS